MLFDATRLIWRRWVGVRPTGIDRICLAWMAHFGSRAQAVIIQRQRQAILPWAVSQALFQLLATGEEDSSGHDSFRRGLIRLALRHGPALAAALIRPLPGNGRIWLNPGHTGLDVAELTAWCRHIGVRPVYLVHDLIPISHPQHCRAGEAERHHIRMRTMLLSGHGLVANSCDTLNATKAFASDQGLPMPPTVVAWPGTPKLAMPAEQQPRPSNDFIILGTIEGRKNHMLLLDVWERLVALHGGAAPRLVIIGRRGWACDDVLARLEAGGFGSRMVETGALSDEAIARHLAGARALLFPSFAEGYGLPLVEALDAGVPVIASDLDVFHEIGQGVPDLLPPDDVEGWAAAIMAYATSNSPVRAAQMARLARFRAPDWPGHFAQVDAFLETL